MNIAIIPARSGSKRLKNKNIKLFFGKPLIYYAIINAKKSKIFDEIIISTNSIDTLNIGKKLGANDNGLRNKKLSDDKTLLLEVIKYEILKHPRKKLIDNVCCILPTNIYNSKALLKLGLKKLTKKIDYTFCAVKTPTSAFRCFMQNQKKEIKMIYPEMFNKGSQLLNDTYFDFGNFYWAKRDTWLKKKIIFSKNSRFIEINKKFYSDINTQEDFNKAKKIFKKKYD